MMVIIKCLVSLLHLSLSLCALDATKLTHSSLSSGVWYDVITFGAPADHHQAFKHGGLKKLLSKHTNLRKR